MEDKSYEVNYKVLNFIYERVKDYHAEIPAFAHELTYCDTKSKIWERFLLQIFENIKHRDNVLFHLMILNSIYTQV